MTETCLCEHVSFALISPWELSASTGARTARQVGGGAAVMWSRAEAACGSGHQLAYVPTARVCETPAGQFVARPQSLPIDGVGPAARAGASDLADSWRGQIVLRSGPVFLTSRREIDIWRLPGHYAEDDHQAGKR
jgi:hypothetical protein